ncbi:MAG: HNH endonuclease [Verrucomicrobiales bacterium]
MYERKGSAWIRDELLAAINLYCKTPFGRIHIRNPEIVALAKLLGRTPGSVSYKLANFASIDENLDRKGASNVSNLDRAVWAEFFADWDGMVFESERRMAELRGTSLEVQVSLEQEKDIVIPEGKTREAVVRLRVNQGFFRRTVLSSYDGACCITGLAVPELLVGSHIVPWAADAGNRTNPRNGLCLNVLHDKAFDRGLIAVDDGNRVLVSSRVRKLGLEQARAVLEVEGAGLRMPRRFLPDPGLLAWHREHVFN